MRTYFLAAVLLLLLLADRASAWWVKGHALITEAAVPGLPDDMPAFFRAGARQLGHCSGDPDRWKNRDAPHLRDAEAPDHFLDLEDFGDHDLPTSRYQAIALLIRLQQEPARTGMLPYALVENFERLSCAFADYRADPDNPAVRAKCLVYAGVLAHFTGDVSMPLHTTRDYDGRKGADGKWVQHGIHAKIDAFPEKNGLTAEEIGRGLQARSIEDVWAHILKTIRESHGQVGRCYELDADGAFDHPTAASRVFILERCRVGAQLTQDLWYTAWVRSAKMKVPY